MIGVLTGDAHYPAAREFFELFKTPWEFYRPGNQYEVLLCCGSEPVETSAHLVIVYSEHPLACDAALSISLQSEEAGGEVDYGKSRLPIYGKHATFSAERGTCILTDGAKTVGLLVLSKNEAFVRIGFNLFEQTRVLLTEGQPVANARIPTLELHIAFLRNLLVTFLSFVVEIPPIPANHSFIVCLTHDVDHVAVRNHKWDATMFGFLYRALLGSVVDSWRGRKGSRELRANWIAALSLPLVHLGLVADFWNQFERYLEIEKGLTSSFFIIPRKGDPGVDAKGLASRKRAAAYEISDIEPLLDRLREAKREIGLHGIDAWRDRDKAGCELEKIKRATGAARIGVRMHWLYFSRQSHAILEDAGFFYDSTIGYNETIGYRAGTGQVFKPLDVERLLELPLHIMDTALFFPSYLDLSPQEADRAIEPMVENAARFGGVLTVNWHDRSIGPERFWDSTYVRFLDRTKHEGAWFATATDAVSWFQLRRSSRVEIRAEDQNDLRLKVTIEGEKENRLPGLRLRVHRNTAPRPDSFPTFECAPAFTDYPIEGSQELSTRFDPLTQSAPGTIFS